MPSGNENNLETIKWLLNNHSDVMTKWEQDFCEEVKTRLEGGRGLTERQEGVVNQLWHDYITDRRGQQCQGFLE